MEALEGSVVENSEITNVWLYDIYFFKQLLRKILLNAINMWFCTEQGMVAHTVIPALWEAETGGLRVWVQSGQFSNLTRLFQKKIGDTAQCRGSIAPPSASARLEVNRSVLSSELNYILLFGKSKTFLFFFFWGYLIGEICFLKANLGCGIELERMSVTHSSFKSQMSAPITGD